jgi:hypothetical protein
MPDDPPAGLRLQEFLQQKDFLPRTMAPVHRVTTQPSYANKGEVMAMDHSTSTAELAIAPGVREVASEDGAVLLDVEQGVCFSLNPVGLKIWELLKKGCSLEQIADALGQEFSVSRPQLVSDATEFIAALEARNLVRRPSETVPKRSWLSRKLLSRKARSSAH